MEGEFKREQEDKKIMSTKVKEGEISREMNGGDKKVKIKG